MKNCKKCICIECEEIRCENNPHKNRQTGRTSKKILSVLLNALEVQDSVTIFCLHNLHQTNEYLRVSSRILSTMHIESTVYVNDSRLTIMDRDRIIARIYFLPMHGVLSQGTDQLFRGVPKEKCFYYEDHYVGELKKKLYDEQIERMRKSTKQDPIVWDSYHGSW